MRILGGIISDRRRCALVKHWAVKDMRLLANPIVFGTQVDVASDVTAFVNRPPALMFVVFF